MLEVNLAFDRAVYGGCGVDGAYEGLGLLQDLGLDQVGFVQQDDVGAGYLSVRFRVKGLEL